MQSDHRFICKLTALRTGKDEKIYRDISTFIFAAANKELKKPKSLIMRLKGIGYWYLRKKRIVKKVTDFPKWDSQDPIKIELNNILIERVKEYEEYSQQRIETKQKRKEC